MAIIYGKKLVFGIHAALPLVGFPAGKIRVRMRADDFVRAFVRDDVGVREFTIEEIDGTWQPSVEMRINFRP